ncbi:TetR/AcrR family transcriptional regulator [Nonomuraea sediminis]|uniref:TetR/AcrR family transcriptional regulator n=1 Tax=Nonomuraea sediminis TaxID=2835864 RepID=UPI001BDDBC66|nr:TetR/AcrR family transcriptional regulator [Nonomuraea sediminis]
MTSTSRRRRPRSDGIRSRNAILKASAELATTEGLRGLSIGDLAQHIGMSKSGLYAHFGSKEELQLATVETAAEIFDADVVRPALAAGDPIEQLTQLLDGFLTHVGSGTFPGGCFFAAAAAELDTHPGQVRERIAEFQAEWMRRLVDLVEKAQSVGDVAAEEDPEQLAFELNSLLALANSTYVMFADPKVFDRARVGIEQRLRLARPAS